MKNAAHAASVDANSRLDTLANLHQQVHETLLEGFSHLNQTLEWGFGSLLWAIDQQTDVLRSIDHTLEGPAQTQANEWRVIGERLRQRAEYDAATGFFLKAVDLNPLDYRIYVGLAHAYLELSRFEEADHVLRSSIPHAPRTPFDYRSVSLRLIGRVRFCNEQYVEAVEQLREAVQLEPTNAKALYDLAQYSACIGEQDGCLAALTSAVIREPMHWYAARAEPLFEPFRTNVDEHLQSMLVATLSAVDQQVDEAVTMLGRARPTVADWVLLSRSLDKKPQSITVEAEGTKMLIAAQHPFDRDDYRAALAAAAKSAAAQEKASSALATIEREWHELLAADRKRQHECMVADQKRRQQRKWILYGLALYLLLAGCFGVLGIERSLSGFIEGVVGGIMLLGFIAIYVRLQM